MTNPEETTIEEAVEITAEEEASLNEIAEAQVRFMVETSPFSTEEWTENNSRPTEW